MSGVQNNRQYSSPVISVTVLNMIHWLLCLSNVIAVLLLLMQENYTPSERQMKIHDTEDEKICAVRLSLLREIWPNERRVIVLTLLVANIKNGLIKHEMNLTSQSLTWAHVMPNGVRRIEKIKGTLAKVEKKVLTELHFKVQDKFCLLGYNLLFGKLLCLKIMKVMKSYDVTHWENYYNKVMIGFLTLMELLLQLLLIRWP